MKITPGLVIGGLLVAGVAYVAFTSQGQDLASSILGGGSSGGFSGGGAGGDDAGGAQFGGAGGGQSNPGNINVPNDETEMQKSGRTGYGGPEEYGLNPNDTVSGRVQAINELAGFEFLNSSESNGAVTVGFGPGVEYNSVNERIRTTLLFDQIQKYPGYSTQAKEQVYITGSSAGGSRLTIPSSNFATSSGGSSSSSGSSRSSSSSSGSSSSSSSASGGVSVRTSSGSVYIPSPSIAAVPNITREQITGPGVTYRAVSTPAPQSSPAPRSSAPLNEVGRAIQESRRTSTRRSGGGAR